MSKNISLKHNDRKIVEFNDKYGNKKFLICGNVSASNVTNPSSATTFIIDRLEDIDLKRPWPIAHIDLRQVTFDLTDLSGTRFHSVNFEGASLRGTNLQASILTNANLQGADMSQANLRDADLDDANLQKANFYQADLAYADLGDANLQKANFIEANLTHAHLWGIDFNGANFSSANLYGSELDFDVDFLCATFAGATMPDGSIHE